ncbi:MAG: HD domain-containing protein, partial [Saprospiraceae bacterium]
MWQLTKNKDWDSLREKFLWVRDMEDVPQDPIFHAEGNVAIHTQMVLEELQKLEAYQELDEQTQEILWAAALLHDVEKRSTTVEQDGHIRSPFHAKKGEYTARQILYLDIPTPFEIREQVAKLVRYHGFPIWALEKKNAKKQLLKVSLEVDTSLVAILAEADMRGRTCEDKEEMLERIEFFKEFCLENKCWGRARHFDSDLAKFVYFQKADSYEDYIPFDDTKCDVYVMCGFPGTGKDFYIKKHFPDLPMVSLDEIRTEFKI